MYGPRVSSEPGSPSGTSLVELVDEADLVVGAHRPALGGADDVFGVVEAGVVEQPLGHPEDLLQRAAEHRADPAGELVGQPGSADLQHPQRGEVGRAVLGARGPASAARPRAPPRCA